MEQLEHSLAIVELFNKIFGPSIAAFLSLFGIHVKDPKNCVADYVVMVLIVALFMIVLFTLASFVCGMTPSSAATTRTTMSVTLAPRARS